MLNLRTPDWLTPLAGSAFLSASFLA